MALYPLLLESTLHIKVWGGHRLGTVMGKSVQAESPYGESWEVHDTSTVLNGVHTGKPISALIQEYGTALIGDSFDPAEGMPMLIKLLDAEQWLSVQVHPDDAQAAELEGDPRGKTEAWVILATEPDAQLVIGVQPGTSRDQMADAIRTGTLEDSLVYRSVQPGDVLYIPANTIHAIGPGILLYEVQQSSNVTYRLYDWNRPGLDGTPRELHIEKGVRVSNVDFLPTVQHPHDELLISGTYFQTQRHTLDKNPIHLESAGAFHAITCIEGTCTIQHSVESLTLRKGQSALIPAQMGAYSLHGNGVVLRSYML